MSAWAELRDWLSGRGLEVVLIILGSILLARFVAWVGSRITERIDRRSTGGDVLVRSEAAKHRHSLTQVLTWLAGHGLEIVLIILGSVLLARFVAWVGRRITDRIDAGATRLVTGTPRRSSTKKTAIE